MGEERDDDDIDREAVLARRRRLVAVAIAGLTSVGGAGTACGPTACLSVEAPRDAGPDTGPDAGDEDAGPADGGPADAG